MSAWVITGECGDYYCGCGVGHLIAVTLDASRIDTLVEQARAATHAYGTEPDARRYTTWATVSTVEVLLDELRPYEHGA